MSRSSSAEHRVSRGLRWLPGLLLAALLAAHAGGWILIRPVQQLDAWLHDARLRLFAEVTPDPRVAIVAIDEASLASQGRWPWSRATLADLVERLFEREGAALVGLDLILAEPDRSSGLATLEEWAAGPLKGHAAFEAVLEARRGALDHDGHLARTLSEHPVVLGFHLSGGAGAIRSGELPSGLMTAEGLGPLADFRGYGGNLAVLQRAATGAGFLNADVDRDGVRRRAPLVAVHEGQVQPSLALAMARAAIGQPAVLAVGRSSGGRMALEAIRMDGASDSLTVPLGPRGQVLLPYPARSGLAPMVSAGDVLAGRVEPGALRGKLVLLGATAPGLADLHATPVAEHLAGVQAHASLLSAVLQGRVPRVPPWAPQAELLALLLGTLALVPMMHLRLRGATLLALGLVALAVAGNFSAWAGGRLGLPLAGPLVLVAGLFGWRVFFGHFLESRDRRRLATLFGQYVPPELVDHMSLDPSRYGMQGRNAELSVMFADLRGFTALSETMDPPDLAALINEFLSEMTEIVRRHGGTLDKYVGDAVMAFWGAPVPDPLHARHAVEAALAMQAAMPALNRRFTARGWPALALGIGVNSGPMVVGDLGSRHRRAYTVLGDAVNVAARLQELSSQYQVGVVLGAATRAALPDWPCREIDTVVLRGRRAPVTIYNPHDDAAAVPKVTDAALS